MRDDDPMLLLLRRVVLGGAIGFAIVGAGALLLGLAVLADPDGVSGGADPTTGAMALVLGWAGLAAGPVVGLRIAGMPWARAAWALPVLPLAVLLFGAFG